MGGKRMRRMRRYLILILCVLTLTSVVHASGTARSVTNTSAVAADGSCSVSLTVEINLNEPASGLTFGLPGGAKNVTMNGSSVRTYRSSEDSSVLQADLSSLNGLIGTYPITFQYTISDVLQTIDKQLYLQLPLLSGFEYPVEKLTFSVTFPGEISGDANFYSGYLNSSVESIMQRDTVGHTISGSTTAALQDRDTLTLSMQVSEEMFPGKLLLDREGNPEVVYMAICAGLALLYWMLMLRCLPIIRQYRTIPPEGLTAGEVGSRLSAAGVDLTMMVFSWAQMGYLKIVPDKYGRVYLQKRMDMGNERTDFECRVFKQLFSRGNMIDGTGTAYAKLCLKVAQTVSGAHEMYRRRAGNLQIFRILVCGVSLFSGICFGMNFVYNPTLQVLLSILLAIVGVVTGWSIQDGMYRFHIRGKTAQYVGAVCMLVWILLGALAGVVWIGVAAVAAQMVAGLAAAYGGRRSSLGRTHASQILGLRHYLKHVSKEEVRRLLDNNPDYFFDMMPYAMALGVDSQFARRFEGVGLPPCAYLTARQNRRRSPQEWALLMRKTADKLDKRQRKMLLEKWLPFTVRRKR